KERDEESGLCYHGARYYAPWLGIWTSCDPAGMVDGANLYRYSHNQPISKIDDTGLEPKPAATGKPERVPKYRMYAHLLPTILKKFKEEGIPLERATWSLAQAGVEHSDPRNVIKNAFWGVTAKSESTPGAFRVGTWEMTGGKVEAQGGRLFRGYD